MRHMTPHAALIAIHLLAAAFWVGGMATLQFALRPAVAVALQTPPQRLALMAAVLQRFLLGVTLAIAALFASGLAMILAGGGFAAQAPGVHAMFGLALVMTALFARIRFSLFPRLRAAVAAADWPAAGAALASLRTLVAINLGLGVLVVLAAAFGRA